MRQPKIAITLGDPRGIGPEVTARAALRPEPLAAEVIVVGPEGTEIDQELELIAIGRWSRGDGVEKAGLLSVQAVEHAVSLAASGATDAIVTAPISKTAIAAAGYSWPGHTEMLRDMTGVPATALCMTAESTAFGGPLRVTLVTGHMALRNVAAAYTIERLCEAARLTRDGLKLWWGIEAPRLAVCAFNPHASDDGLFGDEERRICAPAIEMLRSSGIDVQGPYPADTIFVRAMRGEFDAVLAPYHDVGMTAIKAASFGGAVNVTLGLPFPRTSPDHGTALDIAGTGRADPSSMRAALELAAVFARRALTQTVGPNRLAD